MADHLSDKKITQINSMKQRYTKNLYWAQVLTLFWEGWESGAFEKKNWMEARRSISYRFLERLRDCQ